MRFGPTRAILLALLLTGSGDCGPAGSGGAKSAPSPEASALSPGATSGKELEDTLYRINPSQSRFTARVAVGGPFSALGHDHTIAIREFTGEVRLASGTRERASLRMAIQAGSLVEIGPEFSEKDRRKVDRAVHERALESARYPHIAFESTRVSMNQVGEGRYEAKIEGTLKLHGVTRRISFPARVRLEGNTLRADGKLTVLHSDYKMARISAVAGAVKAKDEIELSFEIVADEV